ncbi:hypothetical protein Aduo_012465 [Ancylostoma duodenale]
MYGPNRLLLHTMEIFERILDVWVRQGLQHTCAIHVVRLLTEVEEAFDRVPRELIWISLRAHGVGSLKTTSGGLSSSTGMFQAQSDVLQGHHHRLKFVWEFIKVLTSSLYRLQDTISNDLRSRAPCTLFYADDVIIAASTREKLQQKVRVHMSNAENKRPVQSPLITQIDRVRNEDVRTMLGVAPIVTKMREARLRRYGHVLRSDDGSAATSAMITIVDGTRSRGRQKTQWLDRLEEDLRLLKLTTGVAFHQEKWRNHTKNAYESPWENG